MNKLVDKKRLLFPEDSVMIFKFGKNHKALYPIVKWRSRFLPTTVINSKESNKMQVTSYDLFCKVFSCPR